MDVRSGYVNVQSETGLPCWRLENETETFRSYDFRGNPWIPLGTWNDIVEEDFPGCNVFSKKTMAHSAGYSDWRSWQRAVTQTGSEYHLFQDGPLWITTCVSYSAGSAHVRETLQDRERAGQGRGFRLIWRK